MNNIVAMILAGGRGKRMDILCQLRPKPVLPFGGKFRVIDFALSNCLHSGITNLAGLLDYRRDDISEYLTRWHEANNSGKHLSLLRPQTGSFAGTADAVYQNLAYLAKQNADDVLILAGDHVYNMDYRKMLDFHRSKGADVTVGVVQVPFEDVGRFGTVVLNEEKVVRDFVEKSPDATSNIASMGIYIFKRDVLARRLSEDARKSDSPHDFGYAILPSMVGRDHVYAYEYDGFWQDIGTVEAYYESNLALIGKGLRIKIDDETWPILSADHSNEVCTVGANGTIVNSLVGPGCVIKGYVENSILSPGVQVEEMAEIRDSVVMARASIGFHSVVSRSILDEDVKIGKFCYVGFGSAYPSSGYEITMVGKEVELPPNTAVGRKCRIMPRVGPASFVARMVPSGSTVFGLEPANSAGS